MKNTEQLTMQPSRGLVKTPLPGLHRQNLRCKKEQGGGGGLRICIATSSQMSLREVYQPLV